MRRNWLHSCCLVASETESHGYDVSHRRRYFRRGYFPSGAFRWAEGARSLVPGIECGASYGGVTPNAHVIAPGARWGEPMSNTRSELQPTGATDAGTPIARDRADLPRDRVSRRADEIGRPRRTAKSLVRFTPDEFAIVAERARTCGRAPARFIREVALGAVPRERRSAVNADVVRQLARIGNNLNQLAARSHSGAPLPAGALDEALSELLAAVRRLEPGA